MKLPTKIEIGGFVYSITIAEGELEGKSCYADVSHYLKRIRVKENLTEEELINSLIHEVLHGIDYVYLNEMLEERTIAVLANGLHQALKQLGFKITYK